MEKISILSENQIKNFNLTNNLEEYIEAKHQDYLSELQENNFEILPWRRLELITAYKNNALMYEDVPEYIKEKHNLPSRDEGIDVIKITNGKIKKVYQCKCYTTKKVTKSKIESFYNYKQEIYNLNDVEFIVVGSLITKIHKSINQLKYDINEDFGKHSKIGGNKNDIKLRYYQEEAIAKIQKAYDDEVDTINIKIPCGCGKTQLIYHYGLLNDYKILILVPKINIAEQIHDYFIKKLHKEINCHWAHCDKKCESNVTLCVYNSVEVAIDENYDITFIDEAHHIISSETYKKLLFECGMYEEEVKDSYIDLISNSVKTKLKVNLSATIDINSEYDYEFELNRAIEEGYLTNYEINVLYVNKLFKYKDILEEDYKTRFLNIVNILNTNKEYKHVLIYCSRVEIANMCVEVLNANNITAHAVTYETKKKYRNHVLRDFKNGLVRVICSVNCLSEGTDLPIADTAIFLNDKGVEINIIQCIGRILRLHKYKNKARIILFDTNEEHGNKRSNYYLRVLDKYDKYFRKFANKYIKIYDHSDHSIDIKEKKNEYFDKIVKFRLTDEEKIKHCQEFYDKFSRLPTRKETFNGWNIGIFIAGLKVYKSPIKETIEKIFNTTIESNPISFEEKCEKCREYYRIFKRLPKTNEIYDDWNIGTFIEGVKYKDSEKELKELSTIFKRHIASKHRISNEEFLEICKEYKNEFNKVPLYSTKFKEVQIGKIINRIINLNQRPEIKNDILELFGDKVLNKRNKINITSEQKIKLVVDYYNKFGRLPKQTDEKYHNFDLGKYLNRLKLGQMESERKEIENKLGVEIKRTKTINRSKDKTFDEKIQLCKIFYDKYKRLPNYSIEDETNAGFKIYDFINNIRKHNNEEHKKIIEEIFKIKLNNVEKRYTQEEKLEILIDFIETYGSFENITKDNQNYNGLNIRIELQEIKRCRSEVYKNIRAELLKRFPNLVIGERKVVNKLNHQIMLDEIDKYLAKNKILNSKSVSEDGQYNIGSFCNEVMRTDRGNSYKDVKPLLEEIFEKHNFKWKTHAARDNSTPDEIYDKFYQYCLKYGKFPRSTSKNQNEDQKYLGNKWKMMNQTKYKETYKELTTKILEMEKAVLSKKEGK